MGPAVKLFRGPSGVSVRTKKTIVSTVSRAGRVRSRCPRTQFGTALKTSL